VHVIGFMKLGISEILMRLGICNEILLSNVVPVLLFTNICIEGVEIYKYRVML